MTKRTRFFGFTVFSFVLLLSPSLYRYTSHKHTHTHTPVENVSANAHALALTCSLSHSITLNQRRLNNGTHLHAERKPQRRARAHTHKNKQLNEIRALSNGILTMVLNKSIKHQMFLKYDFQPQDMVFDMNSIIITIQNASSTANDVPANVCEEYLLASYTWITHSKKE